MALPFWPEPPSRAAMSSMRLSMTSVPSSPACDRHTRMPLLPAPRTVLPASFRPRASSEKMPAPAAPVTVVPVTSPSHASSMTPMAARGDDLAIGDPHAAGVGEVHEAAALGERLGRRRRA